MQIHYGEKGNPRRYCGIKSIIGMSYTTDWKKTTCFNCRKKLIADGFIGVNYEVNP